MYKILFALPKWEGVILISFEVLCGFRYLKGVKSFSEHAERRYNVFFAARSWVP